MSDEAEDILDELTKIAFEHEEFGKDRKIDEFSFTTGDVEAYSWALCEYCKKNERSGCVQKTLILVMLSLSIYRQNHIEELMK